MTSIIWKSQDLSFHCNFTLIKRTLNCICYPAHLNVCVCSGLAAEYWTRNRRVQLSPAVHCKQPRASC